METKLNGIVIDGKFYKADKGDCGDCALKQTCFSHEPFEEICIYFTDSLMNSNSFHFSPELTEKLKEE